MYEGENLIEDEGLRVFYDKIQLITRGRLWSSDRMKAIMEMMSGKYEGLVEGYVERHPEAVGR